MRMKQDVFVHVGYPKSASTTLQKHLFSKHEEIINLGVYPTKNIGIDSNSSPKNIPYLDEPILRILHNDLVQMDSIEFHCSGFYENLSRFMDGVDLSKKVVFSNEKLTSVFFSYRDNGVKARRLAKAFPDAKIIFIIRNQHDWLCSQYRDHPFDPRELTIGRPVSFDQWFNIICWNEQIKLKQMLNYYVVIGFYEKLFGESNIGVFLFEDLVNDEEAFSNKLSDFMGIDRSVTHELIAGQHENRGVSGNYNRARCLLRGKLKNLIPDRVVSKILSMDKDGEKKEHALSLENINRLNSLYSAGNEKLMHKYDLDLKSYGYPQGGGLND
jgi:hypothetical protein